MTSGPPQNDGRRSGKRIRAMKAMLAGFLGVAVIGVVAYFGLHEIGFSSAEVYSGENVRLD